MMRVTGSIITVERKGGPVFYIKARDRTGRQIKKRLGPEANWSKRQRETALREFLVDLGRAPDGPEDELTIADAARAWLRYVEHEKARRVHGPRLPKHDGQLDRPVLRQGQAADSDRARRHRRVPLGAPRAGVAAYRAEDVGAPVRDAQVRKAQALAEGQPRGG